MLQQVANARTAAFLSRDALHEVAGLDEDVRGVDRVPDDRVRAARDEATVSRDEAERPAEEEQCRDRERQAD